MWSLLRLIKFCSLGVLDTEQTFFQNNKQTLSYEHLWDWTRRLAKVASPGAIPTDLSHFVAPLLNISTEGGLQREIKDVIDELNIMIYLQSQQLEVIKSFKKQAEALLSARFHLGSPPTSPLFPAIPASAQINKASDLRSGNKNFDWFQRMSQDLVVAVEGRIAELQTLKDSAESTSASVSIVFILTVAAIWANL